MSDFEAKHVIFRGRVQGVGFRYTAHRIARGYAVTGYVRNLPDGTVEMLVQGPAGDVGACIQDIRESYPDHIRKADITDTPAQRHYDSFVITM